MTNATWCPGWDPGDKKDSRKKTEVWFSHEPTLILSSDKWTRFCKMLAMGKLSGWGGFTRALQLSCKCEIIPE